MIATDRRTFLRAGVGGLAGLLAARWFSSGDAMAAGEAAGATSAKACIVLWLNGGPSHLDTFDPKPGAATGGPFKAIKTRSPAIQLCEHLPRLAERADKIAVVRGMTSREGNHQRAQYLLHTGYSPNPTVVHPSFGAWTGFKLGDPNAELPAFVSLGGPSAGAGILGVQNGPFVVLKAGEVPQNLGGAEGVGPERFARRRTALDWMEGRFAQQTGDAKVAGRRAVYSKAMRLMASPRVAAFDLSGEPAALRASYGDSDFGRGCLTARRLVESGVKFVEVVLDGWDTHQNNFTRTTDLMKVLDPAFSTLLQDLQQRRLLGSTLVACLGDFGRTPKINGNDGRDHYPQAWSSVLAGGGIRGGIVHGQTDALGAKVIADATTVPDLFATLATLLGMNLTTTIESPSGRPIALTDGGAPVHALMA
jgi:uncharacterized protein (DUF1501 family)